MEGARCCCLTIIIELINEEAARVCWLTVAIGNSWGTCARLVKRKVFGQPAGVYEGYLHVLARDALRKGYT